MTSRRDDRPRDVTHPLYKNPVRPVHLAIGVVVAGRKLLEEISPDTWRVHNDETRLEHILSGHRLRALSIAERSAP